jgi:hypothetical protein
VDGNEDAIDASSGRSWYVSDSVSDWGSSVRPRRKAAAGVRSHPSRKEMRGRDIAGTG